MNNHADLSAVRGVILDMDGVLWRDRTPIGDLPAIFAEIKTRDWQVMLATNNAMLSIDDYVLKLAGFGVQLERWQIINSAQTVATYLRQRFPKADEVYVIGEQGLETELAGQGFHHGQSQPVAVVVGMDRGVTYEKLKRASLLLRAGALFVATNPDRTYPTPEGLIPGAGSIVAAIQAASDATPLVIGKPEPEMYRQSLKRMNLAAQETLVVGDRLETDIAGAQRLGCRSALVLSGVTSAAQAEAWQPAPDVVTPDLTSLINLP